MAECRIVSIAHELSEQLTAQELGEDFNPAGVSYNQVLADVRHNYTNYEALLYVMDEIGDCVKRWEESASCSWNPEEEDECFLKLRAHDILKWAAKDLAEGTYKRWQEKHSPGQNQ